MAYLPRLSAPPILVRESGGFPLITEQSNPSDSIGTRRKDAPKRVENRRVPESVGVVPVASGEAGEDMILPVLSTIILGIVH